MRRAAAVGRGGSRGGGGGMGVRPARALPPGCARHGGRGKGRLNPGPFQRSPQQPQVAVAPRGRASPRLCVCLRPSVTAPRIRGGVYIRTQLQQPLRNRPTGDAGLLRKTVRGASFSLPCLKLRAAASHAALAEVSVTACTPLRASLILANCLFLYLAPR